MQIGEAIYDMLEERLGNKINQTGTLKQKLLCAMAWKKTALRLTKRKFQVFQGQKRGRKFQQIRDKSVLIQNTGEKVNACFFLNIKHDLSM